MYEVADNICQVEEVGTLFPEMGLDQLIRYGLRSMDQIWVRYGIRSTDQIWIRYGLRSMDQIWVCNGMRSNYDHILD